MQEIIANILLKNKAVQINTQDKFTWTSGIQSPIYCDNRLLIAGPEAVNLVTLALKEAIEDSKFDIIAGTATAGIPWASFLAYDLDTPMSYVRSKPKDYGTKSQIEGASVKGKKVLLIEDLISTGKSSLEAVEAIRREGGHCNQVFSIFQYGSKKSQDAFLKAKCSLTSITNVQVLLGQIKALSASDKKEVETFLEKL